MAKTPKTEVKRRAPSTAIKMSKLDGTTKSSNDSESLVSSICTPLRRMTRSSARAMLPPQMPLSAMKKKKQETSNKNVSPIKKDGAKFSSGKNRRKTVKLFAETDPDYDAENNLITFSDSENEKKKTPKKYSIGKKVESAEDSPSLEAEQNQINDSIVGERSSVSVENKQEDKSSKTSDNDELNLTFEMGAEVEETKSIITPVNAKKSKGEIPITKNRISIVDLTSSPMLSAQARLASSPLANNLESDNVAAPANDLTFTEDTDDVAAEPASPKVKSIEKKSFEVPRSQKKVPLKKTAQFKSKPADSSKVMSSAKKTKLLEAAKSLVVEKGVNGNKPTVDSSAANDTSKPAVFTFGATGNKPKPFNFELLKGSKIPTWQEMDKQKGLEANSKSVTKSAKKAPNFAAMHQRIFDKDIPINELENRKQKRALAISSKKTNIEENVFKPAQSKSKRKLDLNKEQRPVELRRPLASNNMNSRGRLNADQREERRKQMFKQGGQRKKAAKDMEKVNIKGVRTNRRFDLLMNMRLNK